MGRGVVRWGGVGWGRGVCVCVCVCVWPSQSQSSYAVMRQLLSFFPVIFSIISAQHL